MITQCKTCGGIIASPQVTYGGTPCKCGPFGDSFDLIDRVMDEVKRKEANYRANIQTLRDALKLARRFINGDSPTHNVYDTIDNALNATTPTPD